MNKGRINPGFEGKSDKRRGRRIYDNNEEIEQKFNSLTKDLLSQSQRKELVSLVWKLEEVEDMARVFQLTKI